ncbi:hypothetical protein KSW81_003932 [Nannochloris sp. 'desiccata']|nr:hypothetical protein KSW81_003932 [Chlorella desiccata (nom. nud.)]
MKMIEMLRDYGVEPVLVFDGCRNPAKAPTSHLRAERRKKAEHRARAALASKNDEEARKAVMQTVEVTPQMAYDLIQRLHAYKVQFIVAPYEADGQLAYLANIPPEQGGVAAVLTEDSDLIAYGCNALLFKCDVKGAGLADEMRLDRMLAVDVSELQNGIEIQQQQQKAKQAEPDEKKLVDTKNIISNNSSRDIIDLTEDTVKDGTIAHTSTNNTTIIKSTTAKTGGKNVSFFQWNIEMVLSMCILAGCDFLQSIAGLGFKTAHALVLQGRTLEGTFAHMRQHNRWQDKLTVEYEQGAKRARESFLYALVFDPMTGKTTRLRELPEQLRSLPERGLDLPVHIGPDMDSILVHGIAHGYINPHTMQPFDTRIPPPVPETSRWTVQLHPPKLESSIKYSTTSFNDGYKGGGGGGFSQPGPQNQQRGTGNWFVAGTAAPHSDTVHVSQFVNSPAASGGSGRGGEGGGDAGASRESENEITEISSISQPMAPIASQSRPVEHIHVEDLMQMYNITNADNLRIVQPAAAAVPTKNINNSDLNAARLGPSRFAPTSLAGNTSKASNNPFATVARVPLQSAARPQQQHTQQRQRPQAVATAPRMAPQQQQQRAPAWFKGPNDGRSSQQSVSLGSLLDHHTPTTSANPQKQQDQPRQQHNPKEKKKDGKSMATAPLRLPSGNAPLPAPESQPSVSLAGLFSTSHTTTTTTAAGNAAQHRDQAHILNNSIFFSVSSQHTHSAAAAMCTSDGGSGGGGGSGTDNDKQEVTSPLMGRVGAGQVHNHKAEKSIAMAPRMPVAQPRVQHQKSNTHRRQPHQGRQQQQNTAKSTAWNVRKPTVSSYSSFGAQQSGRGGNSSVSGSQGFKRKSGESGGCGKKSKKVAEMHAAAANCARISSFFTEPKKPT